MPITLYRSTDSGAPELTNVPGSQITVLEACLVTGYGVKAGAGFTKHASSTGTVAAFKSGEATATGHWLVVTDTGTTTIADLYGVEILTNITTFTGQFPLPSQNRQTGTLKASSATIAPWFLVTDGFFFYFGTHHHNDTRIYQWAFGDINTFKVGDQFYSLLIGQYASAHGVGHAASYSALSTHYMSRSYTQSGQSVSVGVTAALPGINRSGAFVSDFIYPSQIDNGLIVVPAFVTEPNPVNAYRGILPGIYYSPQKLYGSIQNYTEFTGIVGLTGKTLMYVNQDFGSAGGVFYDLTGPWR
jgi:hypothetical protein